MNITSLRLLLSLALILGSSSCSCPRFSSSTKGTAAYSMIHLSGLITQIPDPKSWPGVLRKGNRIDLWLTVDNRSVDANPGDKKVGAYDLDDIPENWRIKIAGVADISYRRDTTSPMILVHHDEKVDTGYHFESGYIKTPKDLPNHKRLLVSASLSSHLPGLLPSDKLPVMELPIASFNRRRYISVHATNLTSGAIENIRASVDTFEVFQAARATANAP